MTEIGETPAKGKSVETVKKGKVKVTVRDICTGQRISDATVILNKESKSTGDSDDVVFSDQSVGVANIKVNKHFKEADYSTFIVHYPRILNSHEAKSIESDTVFVEEDKEIKVRIELVKFKVIEKIVFHRRKIIWGAGEGEDKYGHWWTVIDDNTSFGWWPKYPVGSPENRASDPPKPPKELPADASNIQKIQHTFAQAIYKTKVTMYQISEHPSTQTLRGVEGDLNGKNFGGTDTRDAHHVGGDEGDEVYQPVRSDCIEHPELKNNIISFAHGYAAKYGSNWSWRAEAGNHCHTFQKRLMKDLGLDKVKVVK